MMKLEAIGPEEKDKELDVLHLEHVTYTPAPPGPKREGTDPSVHTWISEGGREDSLLEADWSRVVLLPVQSGMKGETVKWVAEGSNPLGCSSVKKLTELYDLTK